MPGRGRQPGNARAPAAGRRARARLWGLNRAPPESGAPAPTLVVPDGPGLIIVEVDIPFSVGLGEEGVGQDSPRSIKGQVVPMPVPVGGWGGRGRVSGCRQMGFLPAVGGVPSGPPAHLVKSITMSAWPSCTSVKVSGVTSLHTWRASATVCRTCSRSSCHGNRRILGRTGAVRGGPGSGSWGSVSPAGCRGQEFPQMHSGGAVCMMWAQCAPRVRTVPHTAWAQLCAVCVLLGGRKGLHWAERTQEPRGPFPDLTVGRPWTPRPAPPAPQAPHPGHFRGPQESQLQ